MAPGLAECVAGVETAPGHREGLLRAFVYLEGLAKTYLWP